MVTTHLQIILNSYKSTETECRHHTPLHNCGCPSLIPLFIIYSILLPLTKINCRVADGCRFMRQEIETHDWYLSQYQTYSNTATFLWYVKLQVAHASGMPGTFPPAFDLKPLVSDPGIHHATCVTHVPWCMSGSLTRGGGENVPRQSRRMRNPQFYVSGKRPMSVPQIDNQTSASNLCDLRFSFLIIIGHWLGFS